MSEGERYRKMWPFREYALVCDDCGASVLEPDVHDAWHERVSAAAGSLPEAPQGEEACEK